VVSTQVLQEYFVASTRKLGVDPELARRKVELFGTLGLVVLDRTQILGAIDLLRLHGLSFWDALIVQAALDANCRVLYSEDFQSGRTIRGLRIRNPFD
jgi:predicted nucleic acid-binding protein